MKYFSKETVMDILDKIERENGHAVASSFPNFSKLKSIDIPYKHGRIVDLDKVLDWLINEDCHFSMVMSAKIDNALKNAPVILEASYGTDN